MTESTAVASFPTERLYWVGVDPVGSDEGGAYERERAFATAAAAEGLDPATMTRLELAEQDARGDVGARYVAAFTLDEGEDLAAFAERQGRLGRAWTEAGFVPRWRVLFERFLEVGVPEPVGSQLVLVAMTPAREATQAQVDEFNAFYNDTHLHEVLRDWDWQRASRYELRGELLHPEPGCPRYLAVYEVGAGSRTVPRSATGVPNYSSGPWAWEHRDTAWRLRYDVV